ncbi:SufD family Fe-S cluster assembly protein [Breoghania sp.]|uniref:SufB/SufD family protein n=1 Tax=Breoghania sp. TaxID=2065378 RepID=UPI002637899C|nr:SufD family Fe-S cluster assembly protein [Breoghania sp.]MDJ0933241.1 SufD family Fe-S cluster assembly protein [Breoghania sp.]
MRREANRQTACIRGIGRINADEQKAHPIVGLNTALTEEGFVLHVPKGETLAAPLHVRFEWSAEAGDRHVRLADEASLTHVRIDRLGASGRLSAVTLGEVGAAAQYKAFNLSEGDHFCRNEALFALIGEGANVEIDGAFPVTRDNHCDNTAVIIHAVPNTTSRQAFRGVLSGRSKSAYQGCVKVAEDAQKTDAYQMSRALLLSREARIATKPELEIYADDVKCSHGATAGEMDGDALFFLRSRGIREEEARAMLVEVFLQEAVETIERDDLAAMAAAAIRDGLSVHQSEVSHAG